MVSPSPLPRRRCGGGVEGIVGGGLGQERRNKEGGFGNTQCGKWYLGGVQGSRPHLEQLRNQHRTADFDTLFCGSLGHVTHTEGEGGREGDRWRGREKGREGGREGGREREGPGGRARERRRRARATAGPSVRLRAHLRTSRYVEVGPQGAADSVLINFLTGVKAYRPCHLRYVFEPVNSANHSISESSTQ